MQTLPWNTLAWDTQQLEVTKSLGLPPNKSNIIPQRPAAQHPAVPHTIP